ncbi:MAG TPA: UDP-N-acetylmuramate--L-alanine ligase [Ktedonobacteraceae bacterium]
MKKTGYRQLKKMRLHLMGIGGQGISAVAQMALEAGVTISGCDQSSSATTRALADLGIPIEIGHSPEHLAQADALIYVPAALALNPNNPELLAARTQGLVMMTWQEMLGQWLEGYCLLSVSGVHGKGTTTAMLSLALLEAGLDPTCEIGAVVPRFGANYRIGQSSYFVNEADEFNNNFWHYHPRLAVVTSLEFEHPEFFADYGEYLASFEHFVRGMDFAGAWPLPPTLILNAGSPGCLELRERLAGWSGNLLTYGVEETASRLEADYVAYDLELAGRTSFKVRSAGAQSGLEGREIQLRLPGGHNVENALAALVAATQVGVEPTVAIRAVEEFSGTRRRFELRNERPLPMGGVSRDVLLVDDYAHHPTAIARTLAAARQRYPARRIVAVYQPHMFSRTKTFFEQFLKAFDAADEVIIVDIYPGRERDTGLVHARDLVAALRQQPSLARSNVAIIHGGGVSQTAEILRQSLRDGDLAIIMGAGDVYQATEQLLEEATTSS